VYVSQNSEIRHYNKQENQDEKKKKKDEEVEIEGEEKIKIEYIYNNQENISKSSSQETPNSEIHHYNNHEVLFLKLK
jgi:hypothetical protein